ncbi:unnamed protein product [Urochloa humidicola]
MRAAIALEFPDAIHRNCVFHIVSKAEILMGPAFKREPAFAMDFYDIVYNCLTEEEFERLWRNMINKYKVDHLKYLHAMYENRKKFVPVYLKNNFFPFICSTSRSEGMNARFKENVGPTSSLILFVKEYDRIMGTMDEKGNLRDKDKAHQVALLHSTYTFEKQARDFYNTQIFYRFQQLVKATRRYIAKEVEKDKVYIVYKSEEHIKNEVRPRKYLVMADVAEENYVCICARFQKDGIVCVHILRTLVQMNKHSLPEKYFIDRWRPIERKQVRNEITFVPAELAGNNNALRYNLLSREYIAIASEGCLSLERTNYMLAELRRIHSEIMKMPVRQENNGSSRMTIENECITVNGKRHEPIVAGTITVSSNGFAHSDISMDDLKNPDVVLRKGRPKNMQQSRRMVPIGEQVRTKQQITCSNCGGHDHNKATCTKPPSDVPVKSKTTARKKATKKATDGS